MSAAKHLIWKVLKANISIAQTIGYVAALFAGLTIIMAGAALFADVSRMAGGESASPLFPDSFRVVSKASDSSPLSFLSAAPGFSENEIKEIASQGFVKRCAPFATSRFEASVTADFGGARFSTAIFFEGVPDDFFETRPASWGFDPTNPVIPIILPSDYLTLYNFGYAPSRGLPKLSPRLITKVPLRVMIAGREGMESFPARVVGFSNRLNTIAVPVGFIEWANSRYGTLPNAAPLRLIVETKGDAGTAAERYFASKGLELSDSESGSGRVADFLRGVALIVAILGIALCLLALFIATLSLGLLISKNRGAIRDLRLLGFSGADVSRGYRRMVVSANIAAYALAAACFVLIELVWSSALEASGTTPAPIWIPLAIGTVVTALISIVCHHYIVRSVDF